MHKDLLPEREPEPESSPDKPYKVVHLRRAEMNDPAVRAHWHDRGFAVLGPCEGHDPHVRCPVCSTDCLKCGPGPCLLTRLMELIGQ